MNVIGINTSPRNKANPQALVEAVLDGATQKWGCNPSGQLA